MRKLSRPWHGSYRITKVSGPNVTVSKVYYPQEAAIQVYQSRIKHYPPNFPARFYLFVWWKPEREGKPPKWVEQLFMEEQAGEETSSNNTSRGKGTSDSKTEPPTNVTPSSNDHYPTIDDAAVSEEPHGVHNTQYGLRQHPLIIRSCCLNA